MTLFIPLDPATPFPHTPSFLAQSSNTPAQLQKVIQSILKAKRIVVVCGTCAPGACWQPSAYNPPGAGISVQAGIPDFRSPDGLFRTLKRDNPRENLASGKDLFDASVFNVRCLHFLRLAYISS
jgi:NAD-dependent histone deacetylase SIR2